MSEILEKKYDVVSFFYGVKGVIIDNGDEIKLFFTYKGKETEIALSRPFPCDEMSLYKMGIKAMDSYISDLLMEEWKNRKLQLHYWYVDELSYGDKMVRIAHGIVSGHTEIADAVPTHTSEVKEITID